MVNGTALQQVSVQVDFTLTSCTEMNCSRIFSIHKYETSTINATAARTRSNYQIVTLIVPRDVFSPTVRENASVEMNFVRGETGFYLGIQERDSCLTINRLLVFYYVCPAMTDDLVTHPETIAPVIGDSTPVEVNGTCVENASPEKGGGPRPTCSQSGDWSESIGDGCVCNPGFQLSSDRHSCEGALPVLVYVRSICQSILGVYVFQCFEAKCVLNNETVGRKKLPHTIPLLPLMALMKQNCLHARLQTTTGGSLGSNK